MHGLNWRREREWLIRFGLKGFPIHYKLQNLHRVIINFLIFFIKSVWIKWKSQLTKSKKMSKVKTKQYGGGSICQLALWGWVSEPKLQRAEGWGGSIGLSCCSRTVRDQSWAQLIKTKQKQLENTKPHQKTRNYCNAIDQHIKLILTDILSSGTRSEN